ncbi:hypothetical protein LCGC14_0208700 [marine sediment metagenome]|uniref:Uncharacterized protein n=1 Tax=marine sediment metagenome TaxID=412755 RepID=A0A0F9UL79_9ZZZZ
MISRVAACALGLACVLAILFIVALRSYGANFDSDWLYEDLTCEELVSAYQFEREVLLQIKDSYKDCFAYYKGVGIPLHGDLHCALIKKEGSFIQGMANDFVAVFNAKRCVGVGK